MKSIFRLYRATFKKVPGFHRLVYAVGENLVIPLLEAWQNFRTPSTDPLHFRLQLLLNQWEPETVAFFKRVVRPGDRVLDIGAHVGYYTRLFARLVGPAGKVVAIEPHPENFRLLEENTKKFSQVIRLNVAAGESEDEGTLYDAMNSINASLRLHESKREMMVDHYSGELYKRALFGFPVRNYKIKIVELDKVLSSDRFRIAKIDIEGAECIAIRGMSRIMSELQIIVFELDRGNLETFGFRPRDLVNLIWNAGFDHFYILEAKDYKQINLSELEQRGNSLLIGQSINIAASRYPL
jgi:FkbM family methyltransferase